MFLFQDLCGLHLTDHFRDFIGIRSSSILSHLESHWLSITITLEQLSGFLETLNSYFMKKNPSKFFLTFKIIHWVKPTYFSFIVFNTSFVTSFAKWKKSIIEVLHCLVELVEHVKEIIDEKIHLWKCQDFP